MTIKQTIDHTPAPIHIWTESAATSSEVMANQDDLVEVVHTLRQVVCVKG